MVFFAVGGVLFVLASGQDEPAPQNHIMVEKAALLEFWQYRQRRFSGDPAELRWDGLSADAKQALIEAFIEEEMLVREARRLGLETNDYIIRRRLVQKLDFIAENQAMEPPDDAELKAWYDSNSSMYRVSARLSFRHLFIKAGPQAEERMQRIKTRPAQTPGVTGAGDPFPYHKTNLNRTPAQLSDHFGEAFIRTLISLTPSKDWQGPIVSTHGLHLVRLEVNEPAHIPPFEMVRNLVAHDVQQQAAQTGKTRLLDGLKNRYQVELAEDMQPHARTQD